MALMVRERFTDKRRAEPERYCTCRHPRQSEIVAGTVEIDRSLQGGLPDDRVETGRLIHTVCRKEVALP